MLLSHLVSVRPDFDAGDEHYTSSGSKAGWLVWLAALFSRRKGVPHGTA